MRRGFPLIFILSNNPSQFLILSTGIFKFSLILPDFIHLVRLKNSHYPDAYLTSLYKNRKIYNIIIQLITTIIKLIKLKKSPPPQILKRY